MAQRRTPSGQGPRRSRRTRGTRTSASRGDAGRSAARPAARRTAANRSGAATRIRARRPRGRVTGRAAILALLLSALVLAYAYPLRTYFAQRAEIERLTGSQRVQERRIAELDERLRKWEDKEYVRAQARQRLRFIRPGDVPYMVTPSPEDESDAGNPDRRPGHRWTWHQRMWGSVVEVDRVDPGDEDAGVDANTEVDGAGD